MGLFRCSPEPPVHEVKPFAKHGGAESPKERRSWSRCKRLHGAAGVVSASVAALRLLAAWCASGMRLSFPQRRLSTLPRRCPAALGWQWHPHLNHLEVAQPPGATPCQGSQSNTGETLKATHVTLLKTFPCSNNCSMLLYSHIVDH